MADGFCGICYRFSAEFKVGLPGFEGGGKSVESVGISSTSLRTRTCRWISGVNSVSTLFPSHFSFITPIVHMLVRVQDL